VLTTEKLKLFTSVRKLMPTTPHVDPRIENAVGRAEPQNSDVNSLKKTRQDLFLEQLFVLEKLLALFRHWQVGISR
jgi:hypothetical protein